MTGPDAAKPLRWLRHRLWVEYWYWRTIGRWPFRKHEVGRG